MLQAGLLVAETEFALQVESDIAPYKGLLMGLFFMTVGMEISVGLFFAEWKTVVSGIVLLIGGKVTLFDSTAPQWPILCTFHTCCDNVSGYLH
jgi:Kef-type K+ transport system membrane component KefB